MKSQLAAMYAAALAENAAVQDGSCSLIPPLTNTKLVSDNDDNDDDDDDDEEEDESESCSTYESNGLIKQTQAPPSTVMKRSLVDMSKEQSPADLLRELFPMLEEGYDSDEDDESLWDEIYENDQEGYNPKVVEAIRTKDLDALYDLLNRGYSFEVCNSNGEYLIHLACRRGDIETVEFLVDEAKVNVNVKDKMGRTVLHDACWRPQRDPELLSYLVRHVDPFLLLAEDNRGHTPFDYVRAHDWRLWKLFCHTQLGDILERMDL